MSVAYSNLPGPYAHPIVGNIPDMKSMGRLDYFLNIWRSYGDMAKIKLGPISAYLISNPEYLHHIFVTHNQNYMKGSLYEPVRLLLGNGIVTSEGNYWRQQRRLMQPPFTPKGIQQYSQLMINVVRQVIRRWQDGETRPIEDEMRFLAMNVISHTVFGDGLPQEKLDHISESLEYVFFFMTAQSSKIIQLPIQWPTPANKLYHHHMTIINEFIDERIHIAQQKPAGEDNTIISRIVHAQDEETGATMDHQAIRDELITLFFAGHETTAYTMTWAWYLLAQHPHIWQKMADEADQVIKQDEAPSLDEIHQLTYTHQVIEETLRLYPAAGLLGRTAVHDDIIGGYFIPKGTTVFPFIFAAQRHPDFWQNPAQFDPDRFTPEAKAQRYKHAYIPFLNGPRICIGNHFAMLEMVLALSLISRQYQLELVDKSPIAPDMTATVRPSRSVVMRLQKR